MPPDEATEEKSPPPDIGELYRVARARKKHTQGKAAAAVGVNRVTWWHWENERNAPEIRLLKGVADYLGMTTDDLLAAYEAAYAAAESEDAA